MARTKQTRRKRLLTPATMTWTRFYQPQDREWPPAWPFAGTGCADDLHLGPLAGVKGIERVWIGRMVDSPEEAVYLIEWTRRLRKEEEFVELERFWASHACGEFLDNLPESRVAPMVSGLPSPQTSAGLYRRRFLVLKLIHGMDYHDMGDRVTFTAFLAPLSKNGEAGGVDESFEKEPYERLKKVFGETQMLPYYAIHGMAFHSRTWWQGPTVPFTVHAAGTEEEGQGLADQQRLERNLLGKIDSIVDGGSGSEGDELAKGRGGSEVIICQIHRWRTAISSNMRLEDNAYKDLDAREEWLHAIEEGKTQGLLKAWKKERWDIRPVPELYGGPVDEFMYEHSEEDEFEALGDE